MKAYLPLRTASARVHFSGYHAITAHVTADIPGSSTSSEYAFRIR
jgi:hypothetical protein